MIATHRSNLVALVCLLTVASVEVASNAHGDLAVSPCSYTSLNGDRATSILPIEVWRRCIVSEGAVLLYERNITTHAVNECFGRCRDEPLCTVFEAVPSTGTGSRFCQLWKVCKTIHTQASSISGPVYINAYSLSGECQIEHLAAVQESRPSPEHSALDTLREKVSADRTIEGTEQALYEDPRFADKLANFVSASLPGQRGVSRLSRKAWEDVIKLCADIVNGYERYARRCQKHFAQVAVDQLASTMIEANSYSVRIAHWCRLGNFALSQLLTVQADSVANAVKNAYEVAGGGSSKSAAIAGGKFAEAIEYAQQHGHDELLEPLCADQSLAPSMQTCSSLGKLSCRFEKVRKACCMCEGGGSITGTSGYSAIYNKTLVFIGGSHFSGTVLIYGVTMCNSHD